MKRNFTRLGGLMAVALMVATSLTAQRAERVTVKTHVQEWRENIPDIQPRAATHWPDSAVTYTAAGEKSSKSIFTYDADGTRSRQSFEWTNNQWVPADNGPYYSDPVRKVVLWGQRGIMWPHPNLSAGGYAHGVNNPFYDIKSIPTHDSKGNLIRLELHVHEIANPDNSYLSSSYDITYNNNNQPVLIEGYSHSYNPDPVLSCKVTYQYDSNGNNTFYEESVFITNTNQWMIVDICTSNNGVIVQETYDRGSGEKSSKTIYKTDSEGNRSLLEHYYTWTAGKWYMTHYTIFYPNDLTPSVETGNNTPVGEDNKGGFDINITFPADSIAGGSLTVRLPDGLTLDKDNTRLTIDLGDFELVITQQEDNSWLLELKSGTARSASLRSDGTESNPLLHVAYTVGATVQRGVYDAIVHSLLFETPGGSVIAEPAITVPVNVNRWGVGNEQVTASEPAAYVHDGILTIRSDRAEQITVYSVSDARLYEGRTQAGTTTIATTRFPQGVLIVKGNGWVRKIRN
jgi:hypothetical protein